jgi:hypothetical protein
MSRSYKKYIIHGIAVCASEKSDKRTWHRRWRRTERIALSSKTQDEYENHIPRIKRELIDVWRMGKDGKTSVDYDIYNSRYDLPKPPEELTDKERRTHHWENCGRYVKK